MVFTFNNKEVPVLEGFKKVIDSLVAQREKWLARCVSNETVLYITFRKGGQSFYGVYVRHSQSSITLNVPELEKNREGATVLSGATVSKEQTFNFVDITMEYVGKVMAK